MLFPSGQIFFDSHGESMQKIKSNPNFFIKNLIDISRNTIKKISENSTKKYRTLDLPSILMSGIAIFYFKHPSLLSFDGQRSLPTRENLKNLFQINQVPSDTYFREVVDKIDNSDLINIFKDYFSLLKSEKVLNGYRVFGNKILVSLDGTGFFQSSKVNCACCLQRKTRDGKISYEHQALPAVIIHPDKKEVFPIGLEIIEKQDGENKNDCERNASKRLLANLRKNYPKLDMIIVEDSLASNGPHVKELVHNKMSFILGIKPGDHKIFFEKISDLKLKNAVIKIDDIITETKTENKIIKICYKNIVDLSSDKQEIYVNYLEMEETILHKKTGMKKVTKFTWITDMQVDKRNVYSLSKMGRARWKIENETFNTLKNQGYHFEHNYGHGEKNLANNMCAFMCIAFLIDQIQQASCRIYQEILQKFHAKYAFFETIRVLFNFMNLSSFQDLYQRILDSHSQNNKKVEIYFENSS